MLEKDKPLKTEIPGRYRELSGVYKLYFRLVTVIAATWSFFIIFRLPIFG